MQGTALDQDELREILFTVNGNCGYPLADALKMQYAALDGWDDEVFETSRPTANIRLEVRRSASVQSIGGIKPFPQWLSYQGWGAQVGVDALISFRGLLIGPTDSNSN